MPGIDLHTHSNRSDGTFTPRQLIELAAERGLSTVALSDHDTTDGLDDATQARQQHPGRRRALEQIVHGGDAAVGVSRRPVEAEQSARELPVD